jgi:hypothetical protein
MIPDSKFASGRQEKEFFSTLKQGMPSQGDAQLTMPEQSDVGRETSSRGGKKKNVSGSI